MHTQTRFRNFCFSPSLFKKFFLLSSLIVPFWASAQSNFLHFFTHKYEGRVFPKNQFNLDQCDQHALHVAQRISQVADHEILTIGCREFETSFQVFIEYGSSSLFTLDKFRSPETTSDYCNFQTTEYESVWTEVFPNSAVDVYCAPSSQYEGFFNLHFDYRRPQGFVLTQVPFSPNYPNNQMCADALSQSIAKLEAWGLHPVFSRCSRISQNSKDRVEYGFISFAFMPSGNEFKFFRGSAESLAEDCQRENSAFSAELEKFGVKTLFSQCKQSSKDPVSSLTVYEPKLPLVTEFVSQQQFSSREACEDSMALSISRVQNRTPVVFGFCRKSLGSQAHKWNFSIWHKRL